MENDKLRNPREKHHTGSYPDQEQDTPALQNIWTLNPIVGRILKKVIDV